LFAIEPQLRNQGKFKSHLRLSADKLGYVSELIAEMEEELQSKNPGYRFMAAGHLMRLIGYLSRCYSEVELGRTKQVAGISRLLSFLNASYSRRLTVTEMTEVAHMSQSSLMRTFGEITGRSPVDYLIRVRISRAASLLRTTALRVTEIAAEVGFDDSNYFARQFRKIQGTSPREYRKQQST
jgi:AraC-like DNA-binding protein